MKLTLELEQLIRLVALKTGKTPEAILKEAVEAWARQAGIATEELRRMPFDEAKIKQLIERTAALPLLDPRTPDAIIGYNEHGLPE